jgi:hypothetical protein
LKNLQIIGNDIPNRDSYRAEFFKILTHVEGIDGLNRYDESLDSTLNEEVSWYHDDRSNVEMALRSFRDDGSDAENSSEGDEHSYSINGNDLVQQV